MVVLLQFTWRGLGHEIEIHHIWNPQSHELQHHTG